MSEPNQLLEAALTYAKRGWRVIPLHNLTDRGQCTCQPWRDSERKGICRTPAKHPLWKKYAELASTDEVKIRAWWAALPSANVGIIGGRESGIWALDTDPRNAGDVARDHLVFLHGQLPYTMTARTGGGGTHEYWRWPKDFDLPNAMVLEPGLEVVAEGHVLVAAPSFHPSGQRYAWEEELGPDEMEVQDAPGWLLDLLRGRVTAAAASATMPARDAQFPLADIGKILNGCDWMRHCADDAATLSEPEWYAQLSIVGRCENGEALAHELSSAYRGYSRQETSAKLRHALIDTGPVTCAKVKNSLGGARYCDACPNWGAVKSPAVLGIRSERPGEGAPIGEPPPPEKEHGGARGKRKEAPIPIDIEARVREVIEADDVEAALRLGDVLAGADTELLGVLKHRLRTHFRKRLSIRDLERGISAKRGRGSGGNSNGPRKPPVSGGGGGEEIPWEDRLICGTDGMPRANLANAITALRYSPEWHQVLWRDEFAERTVVRAVKAAPIAGPFTDGVWTNLHDIQSCEWLQRRYIDVSLQITGLAIEAVANDQRFHPVREYLAKLQWDGLPRLDEWLVRYLGAIVPEPTPARQQPQGVVAKLQPTSYLAAVGAKWLISAMARVFRPGCKADCMLVLEGKQGLKKSTALNVIAGDWFTDVLESMGTKDSRMQVAGKWMIEISELGSMTKAEIEDVKGFMSCPADRFRPPYAGRLVEIPRQCIFGGTVNPETYLKDDTGGRRFWPVECTRIDIEALRRDRDQLLAEARVRFDDGATWWLDVPEVEEAAEVEQLARYRQDVWHERVDQYLRWDAGDEITITQILEACIKMPIDRQSVADGNRIASILRLCGWRKARPSRKGVRSYVYVPAEAAKLAKAKQEVLTS